MSLQANEAEHFSRGLQAIIYLFFFFFFGNKGLPRFLCRLSLVAASEGYSSLWRSGFSLQWLLCCRAQAPGAWASVAAALEFTSCGVWVLGRSGFNRRGIQAEKLWLVALEHAGFISCGTRAE